MNEQMKLILRRKKKFMEGQKRIRLTGFEFGGGFAQAHMLHGEFRNEVDLNNMPDAK